MSQNTDILKYLTNVFQKLFFLRPFPEVHTGLFFKHVRIHVSCPLGLRDLAGFEIRLFSLGHSRCPSMGPVSSWNNGLWTVTMPHGSCHPSRHDWHAQFLFKYWIGLKITTDRVLQGGVCRKKQEIWNVTASPHLSYNTSLCHITFSMGFCRYRNGHDFHNCTKVRE